MEIKKITDPAFGKYGRIVGGIDFSGLLEALQRIPIPENVVYEPSTEILEKITEFAEIQNKLFGELPIQIGYCNGHNKKLNALEYHRSSEINVVQADAVFLVGLQQDITEGFTYETSLAEAFHAPAGTAVELYATTLHYAPCNAAADGFRVAVILPKGTNLPLETAHTEGEGLLMAAKNKWLIGHEDGGLPKETHIGLTGENISIK